MNIEKIKRAAEIAKTKTTDKRWLKAIDAAVAGVESGWIVTYETHGIMVTTDSGNTYRANGSCQCKAFEFGQACKHRALARLVEIADTLPADEKAELIAEIKTKLSPADITIAIGSMFGPYSLHHLHVALLRELRAAII